MRKGWKVGIVLGSVAILCAGVTGCSRYFFGTHIIPVSEQQVQGIAPDLRWTPQPLKRPGISLAEIRNIAKGAAGYMPMSRSNAEILAHAAEIEKGRKATDAIETLIAGKQLIPPLPTDPLDGSEGEGFQITRLYTEQFALAIARGDTSGAIGRFHKAAEVCDLLQKGQGGISFDRAYLYRSMIRFATLRRAFSQSQLASIYSLLPVPPTLDSELPDILRYEFQRAAHHISTVNLKSLNDDLRPDNPFLPAPSDEDAPPPDPPSGTFDGPATIELMAKLFREAIRNTDRPWGKVSWPEELSFRRATSKVPPLPEIKKEDPIWTTLWQKGSYGSKMRAIPNSLGLSYLNGALSEGAISFVAFSTRQRTELNAWRLMVAMQIYERRFKKYPPTLAGLKILGLPGPESVDCFSDAPFRYDWKRNIFWSVGPDGRDDGGSIQKDVVYRLP